MKVLEKEVDTVEEQGVLLSYVNWTKEFEEIRDFCRNIGGTLTVYTQDKEMVQIPIRDILYVEAVGDLVFCYTSDDVYEVKSRLYQLQEQLEKFRIVRGSKSVLINIYHIVSVRPALNGRLYAKMENGEEILITRSYAKGMMEEINEGI